MNIEHQPKFGLNFSAPFCDLCDNQNANSLASNSVYHARTKHVELDES